MKARIYPSQDFTIGGDGNRPDPKNDYHHYVPDWDAYRDGYKIVNFIDPVDLQNSFKRFVRDRGIGQAQRKRRGLNGISPEAKRKIRSGAQILENEHRKECLTFGTATLPRLTKEEEVKICEQWSEIVRQFFQELTRILQRAGLPTDYVQVTEIQSKRFKERNEFAPHLHWICTGRKSRYHNWSVSPEQVRDLWARILYNATGINFDCSKATRIEQVKHSAGGYIAKYLSKGKDSVDHYIEAGLENLIPKSWYGISKPLKQKINANIIRLSGAEANTFADALHDLQKANIVWFREVQIPLNPDKPNELTTIGFIGKISREFSTEQVLNLLSIEIPAATED